MVGIADSSSMEQGMLVQEEDGRLVQTTPGGVHVQSHTL